MAKDHTIPVRGVTIDNLMERWSLPWIDILKADIEGAERHIFRASYISWLKKVRILIIELHEACYPGTTDIFQKALRGLNCEVFQGERTILSSTKPLNLKGLQVKSKYIIFPDRLLLFTVLALVTIVVTYRFPGIFASIWYVFLLVLYFLSKDEAFWLAFFLITVDGFMGFMGPFTVTLNVLPDLPAIELCQFYILVAFVKAARSKSKPFIFYKTYIQILLVYILFLIVWGQMMGYSGELNAYFRIIKQTLPFIMFYSIPRLFTDVKVYERFLGFVFFILIIGFLISAVHHSDRLIPFRYCGFYRGRAFRGRGLPSVLQRSINTSRIIWCTIHFIKQVRSPVPSSILVFNYCLGGRDGFSVRHKGMDNKLWTDFDIIFYSRTQKKHRADNGAGCDTNFIFSIRIISFKNQNPGSLFI